MGLSILLSRKYRCLPTLLTELVDKKRILCGSLTTSCSLYGKKNKNSGYEHVDQEKHGDLVHRLTSCKDSYQTPESLFEDSILYGPASKYKPPAQGVVEPKFPRNWIPLTNPNKSALPQKTVPGVPLQISLQRNRMASVTTVLQLTMPLKQAFYLERWKQQMILELGKEGFAEYTKNIFQQGKLFHGALEALLLSEEILEQEEDCSVSGYVASVQHVLQDVTRVRALESAVQHETLHYKGLVDCVAEYRGTLCVIDWKTSGKPKPFLQNTFDSPLQIAAYVGALNHDGNYDFQVDCGLLVVAYKDGSPAHPHYMDSELCSQYWNKWLLRLEEYKGKDSGTVYKGTFGPDGRDEEL
ncbi:mitochondrial genome maintenance exonuclease 1 isoform X3 [Hemicordylus capensis]|uniref:mitochondrial genome maintenance exonuclease 1 isoform X3 n=1 Tax=Hemicordylus capensis TaxID=884348 RepID=UPI002304096C|nr:mitochondrial genome maintenance exonuclease 1 isoform X3 [Hemicordylus capensis]